jgi:thiamine-phosphate pyrophosphorylase
MQTNRNSERQALLRGLYAITPETDDLPRLLALVRSAIDGGARLVQYRAKQLAARSRLRQAQSLLDLCRARGVPLIVNDDLELAVCLAADGVHLGAQDSNARAARERFPQGILGISCYDQPARAVLAAAAGADYVGIGSVFASPTKPDAVHSGLAALGEARRAAGIPVAAIGGITAANAAQAVAAGADMVAVISALFDSRDVFATARAISRIFDTEPLSHVRAQPAAL